MADANVAVLVPDVYGEPVYHQTLIDPKIYGEGLYGADPGLVEAVDAVSVATDAARSLLLVRYAAETISTTDASSAPTGGSGARATILSAFIG